jgi:hypothetical protein
LFLHKGREKSEGKELRKKTKRTAKRKGQERKKTNFSICWESSEEDWRGHNEKK